MIEYRFTGVLERAAADHERVLALMLHLPDVRDSGARGRLVALLARELERHAAAEAATLYAAVRALPGAGDLMADADAEHDEIGEALADLVATAPDHPTWGEMLAALRTCVEQHIDTEEGEIFPVAEELLGSECLLELGRAFAQIWREESAATASASGQTYTVGTSPRVTVPFPGL